MVLPSVCATAEGAVGEVENPVIVDCDGCAVRDVACGDCVMTVLLGGPPRRREVDDAERAALEALAEGGLVPRLRLVPVGLPRGFPAGPSAAAS